MVRIIVSGGIGSGKSTVTSIMQGLGAAVIHADEIGHSVLDPEGEAFGDVVDRWPAVVSDGRIDRKQLATIVFSDPMALAELEAFTHPAIGRKLREITGFIHAWLLVVEIPVLREFLDSDWTRIVVTAHPGLRQARLASRGMTIADIEARIGAQPSDAEWIAAADHVIANNGSVEELEEAVRAFVHTLIETSE